MMTSLICLLLILPLLFYISTATPHGGDCNTLLQFVDSFTITRDASRYYCDDDQVANSWYPKTKSWKKGNDCCSWDGVTCDDNNNVIELDLSCSWLQGSFPEFNNTLFSLRSLNLSGNNLSERLPSRSHLFSANIMTHLDLSGCNLTKIPIFLSSTKALQYLDLSGNRISGEIPSWLWRSWNDTLKELYLFDNFITGGALQQFPWRNVVKVNLDHNLLQGSLQNLVLPPSTVSFSVANNNINGKIPSSICQASSIRSLCLDRNQLSGAIPECIGNLTNLRYLSLGSNRIQGPIPRSLSNCSSLRSLNASYNIINDTFDHELHLPLQLEFLYLQFNKLNGPVAPFIAPRLALFMIGSNNLSGQWPRNFFLNLSHSLTTIDLSNNNFQGPLPVPPPTTMIYSVSSNSFTGEIPRAICSAFTTQWIDLSNNSLHGKIPKCLTNLESTLSILNLGKNQLRGEIPDIFARMNKLRTLDLSQNKLVGAIPRSMTNCTNLEVLDLCTNNLEDTFPSWLGVLPKLQVLSTRSNRFHGFVNFGATARPFSHLLVFDIAVNNFSGLFPSKYLANFGSMMSGDNRKQGNLQFLSNNGVKYHDSMRVIIKGVDIKLVRILTVFMSLDLSMNSFQGHISQVVGNLKALKGFNFSHNNLSGSIPSSIGNLTNLEWLDLSSNDLNR